MYYICIQQLQLYLKKNLFPHRIIITFLLRFLGHLSLVYRHQPYPLSENKGKPTRIIPSPPIPIIPYIPRPKHTIQQPPSNPIRPVLAIGLTKIEKRTRSRAACAPYLQDTPSLTLGTDMVPVEGRVGGGIGPDAVQQVAAVLVHEIVDVNCFVLDV